MAPLGLHYAGTQADPGWVRQYSRSSYHPDWEMPIFIALRVVVVHVVGFLAINQAIYPRVEILLQGPNEASIPPSSRGKGIFCQCIKRCCLQIHMTNSIGGYRSTPDVCLVGPFLILLPSVAPLFPYKFIQLTLIPCSIPAAHRLG